MGPAPPSVSAVNRRMREIALAVAPPAALLLIVIGFFWKIVLTNQFSWIESPDIANQVVPWLDYQAQQFHLHRIPMWDPFLFGGQSLIGQGQSGLAYPLNWILFLLPLEPRARPHQFHNSELVLSVGCTCWSRGTRP